MHVQIQPIVFKVPIRARPRGLAVGHSLVIQRCNQGAQRATFTGSEFDKLSVSVLGTGPDARRANELLSAAKAEIDKASFELDTLLDELRRIKPLTSVRMGAEQAPIQAPVHAKGDRPGIGEAARAASRDGAGTPRSDPFQQAA